MWCTPRQNLSVQNLSPSCKARRFVKESEKNTEDLKDTSIVQHNIAKLIGKKQKTKNHSHVWKTQQKPSKHKQQHYHYQQQHTTIFFLRNGAHLLRFPITHVVKHFIFYVVRNVFGAAGLFLLWCLVVFAEQGWILYKILKPAANFVTTSHVSSDPVRFQVQQKKWKHLRFAKPFRKWGSPLYPHVCKIGADWSLNRNQAPYQYFLF